MEHREVAGLEDCSRHIAKRGDQRAGPGLSQHRRRLARSQIPSCARRGSWLSVELVEHTFDTGPTYLPLDKAAKCRDAVCRSRRATGHSTLPPRNAKPRGAWPTKVRRAWPWHRTAFGRTVQAGRRVGAATASTAVYVNRLLVQSGATTAVAWPAWELHRRAMAPRGSEAPPSLA